MLTHLIEMGGVYYPLENKAFTESWTVLLSSSFHLALLLGCSFAKFPGEELCGN